MSKSYDFSFPPESQWLALTSTLHFQQFTDSSHSISEVWLQPSDSLQQDVEHVSRGSLSSPKDRYVRLLGILLDENLFFKHHIDLIKTKVSIRFGILRKHKHIFPGSILRILFCSLVQSYNPYRHVIWMSTFPLSLKPLLKLYDKARTLIQKTNRSSLKP